MADSEPVVVTARKALVAAAAALLLNPLSVMLGIEINRRTAKPDLVITAVEPFADEDRVAEGDEMPLPGDSVAAIRTFTPLTYELQAILDSDCYSQFTLSKVEPRCAVAIRDAASGLKGVLALVIAKTEGNASTIEDWNPAAPLSLAPLDYNWWSYAEAPEKMARQDKPVALSIYRNLAGQAQLMSAAMDAIMDATKGVGDVTSRMSRTGEVTFEVGFLNRGDTDGVVFPKGELQFDDVRVPLTSPGRRSNYRVVSAHGYTTSALVVDSAKARPEDVGRWKALVLAGTQQRFKITCATMHGEVTSDGVLPPLGKP